MNLTSHWIFIILLASLPPSTVLAGASIEPPAAKSLTARQATFEFHQWENVFGNGPWCWFWCKKPAKTKSTSSAASPYYHARRNPGPPLSQTSNGKAGTAAQELDLTGAQKALEFVKQECAHLLGGRTRMKVIGKGQEKRDEDDTFIFESSSTATQPSGSTDTDLPGVLTDPVPTVTTTSEDTFDETGNNANNVATSLVIATANVSSTHSTATGTRPSSSTASPKLASSGNTPEALTMLGGLVIWVMGLMLLSA